VKPTGGKQGEQNGKDRGLPKRKTLPLTGKKKLKKMPQPPAFQTKMKKNLEGRGISTGH